MKNGRNHQSTPQGAFDWANLLFGPFDIDVAASPWNAKCERFYTETDNGLTLPWTGRIFCNPPWSDIGPWVDRALTEIEGPAELICMLLPVRGSRTWYVDLERSGAWRIPIYGRLKFSPPPGEESGHGGFEDSCFWVLVPSVSARQLMRDSSRALEADARNAVIRKEKL